nr:hypothetical protein [Candidatus Sigynarchaeum springense]
MDKKQLKELLNSVKKSIKDADKLAKNDVNGAFQTYRQAAEWLQHAADDAEAVSLYKEVVAKMQELVNRSQQQPAAQPATQGAPALSFATQQGTDQISREQRYNIQAQQHYAQQQQAKGQKASTVQPPARQAGGWTPLVFTHGQELEVQLVRQDGTFLSGEEMVHLMSEMVKEAYSKFKQWMDAGQVPQFIVQKMGGYPVLHEDHEKGLVMQIPSMLPTGQRINIDSFGRDGNVAAITYILELVTPICQYVEELAWWESTLFSLAYQVLAQQKSDLFIVGSGLNGTVEYMRGLSFGDHSHIGTFQSPLEKIQFYDMLRNFIPAIIALSVNSPIVSGKPTDEIKIVKGRYAAPNCVRSIRLLNNTTMLSGLNNPAKYPPYLLDDNEQTRQQFLQTVGKADFYDARFQDVYPYTDFGTIEVRVCDAQISVARRIGLCMLLQALGYKTRKLIAAGRYVPGASSECIVKNRDRAVRQGLFGVFTTEGIDEAQFRSYDPEFANMYLGDANSKPRYIFEHVDRMFRWLAPELKELCYSTMSYLQPLLSSVYGDLPNGILPPFTEADYQLSLFYYKLSQRLDPNIVPELITQTKQHSVNATSYPFGGATVRYPPGFQ